MREGSGRNKGSRIKMKVNSGFIIPQSIVV